MEGWMNKRELAVYIGAKSIRTVERWVSRQILPRGKRFPSGLHWEKTIVDQWLLDPNYKKMCNRTLKEAQASR